VIGRATVNYPLQQGCEEEALSQDRGGRVVNFVVQLEVEVEGEWKQVVRYDCTHKFVHRDSYDLRGKQRKEAIDLSYEEALTFADEDLDENWERYGLTFLAGGRL